MAVAVTGVSTAGRLPIRGSDTVRENLCRPLGPTTQTRECRSASACSPRTLGFPVFRPPGRPPALRRASVPHPLSSNAAPPGRRRAPDADRRPRTFKLRQRAQHVDEGEGRRGIQVAAGRQVIDVDRRRWVWEGREGGAHCISGRSRPETIRGVGTISAAGERKRDTYLAPIVTGIAETA